MAVDESLEMMGGSEVKTLTQEQKKQLITFMDFVEAEPDPSIKCLREANWDLNVAMNNYLRKHPDHPKSRGNSLDLTNLFSQDVNGNYIHNFNDDIHLPPDLDMHLNNEHATQIGRRGSTELDEVPNGTRQSDDDPTDDSSGSDNEIDNGAHDSEE